jgi:glycosyltransferase involved in cell wall biosynthesis
MRVLILTKLFPNRAKPLASAFNRQQFGALARLASVDVVAPLPWFPGAQLFKKYTEAGQLTGVPRRDNLDGLSVEHPRILHIPGLGRPFAGVLTTASLLPLVRRYVGRVDVVLGSWAYPHGMTTVALARLLGVPAVIKVHGSDLNVLGNMKMLRAQMKLFLPRATRVVAVSRALAARVMELGVSESRIDLVYNGVDAAVFHPRDARAMRRDLGQPADSRDILFVGGMLETKGVNELAKAYCRVHRERGDAHLVMVGDGPARRQVSDILGNLDRVHLPGARPLVEVARWMGAADVITLPSWNEGTPNVVLEALATGRRVVATNVGGIPDLITSEELGTLVPVRDADALASALIANLEADYEPARVVELGSRGSWEDSARSLYESLERSLRSP